MTAVPDRSTCGRSSSSSTARPGYADEHDYDAWEALWTDDALYWVPAGRRRHRPRWTRMSVIYDNRNRISTRLKQLRTGRRLRPGPAVRPAPGHLQRRGARGRERRRASTVGANFVLRRVARARATRRGPAGYTYRLRLVDGELRMACKKVVAGRQRPAPPHPGVPDLRSMESSEELGPPDRRRGKRIRRRVGRGGHGGQRPRLRLEDRGPAGCGSWTRSSWRRIVWLPGGTPAQLLDPSADRWRGDE